MLAVGDIQRLLELFNLLVSLMGLIKVTASGPRHSKEISGVLSDSRLAVVNPTTGTNSLEFTFRLLNLFVESGIPQAYCWSIWDVCEALQLE